MLLVALAVAGCGYRPVGAPSPGGRALRTVEIAMFENLSREPGVEQLLSDAFQEEFARRGQLAPRYVSGGEPADGSLRLEGVVQRVTVSASAFSNVALAVQDRLDLEIDVEVTAAGESTPLWRHEGLTYSERFPASADPQVYRTNKEQAMRRLASEIASRIHDELYQIP